jgi:hypothetical protein
MVDAAAGPGAFTVQMFTSAWAAICRAGAYHAPHSHSDRAWSGVYYVDAGTASTDYRLSGVLEFLDPRRRGGRERAGRPIRGTGSSAARSRVTSRLPKLALSLGPPLCGPIAPHLSLVQRESGCTRHCRPGIAEAIASGGIEPELPCVAGRAVVT